MDAASTAEILSSIPFIQKLEAQDEGLISRLSPVARLVSYKAGTIIFRQGDPGENFYFVLKGLVGVHLWKSLQSKGLEIESPTPRLRFDPEQFECFADGVKPPSRGNTKKRQDVVNSKLTAEEDSSKELAHTPGSSKEPAHTQVHYRFCTAEGFSTFTAHSVVGERVGQLSPGHLFGELALMNNAPRATTIRCIQDSTFLTIAKEEYYNLRNDLLQASETQVIEDFCAVLRDKCGSVVKAWRSVLDPQAVGELLFSEFVEALTSLHWQGNTSSLWGALVRRAHLNNRDTVVGLSEVSPDDNRALEQFKSWLQQKFDGAIEFFQKLTGKSPNASVSYAEFMRACQAYRVPAHLKLVWEFLDPDGVQAISLKDIAYLEISGLKRKAAMDPSFVMSLEAAKTSSHSQRKRARLQQRAQNVALTDFLRKLKAASGGSFIRGFRNILDRNGNLCISKVEMLKGCRQVAFSGDFMALWKAMDQDGDGSVQLPEMDVRMALVLASFKKWCSERHGGCVNAMQHLAAINKRRTSKWNLDDFINAILNSGWQGLHTTPPCSMKQAAAMVHEAADDTGTRSIIAQDVAFLDKWEPTPWLCEEPDYEGKNQLILVLQNRYKNLIVAWRRLFDRNNKNKITFKEFQHACGYMQIKNPPGIWRALDTDHCGFISLKSIDPASAQVLLDFKEWAEDTFGSIQFAFRVLDATHSNAVSLPVFKRMLSEFGLQVDARILFQSLKPDVGGKQQRDARLRLDDMKHLQTWESPSHFNDASDDEQDAEIHAADAKGKHVSRQQQASEETLAAAHKKVVDVSSIASPGRLGSSRSHSSMSDFFHYCRVAKEHEVFIDVRDKHLTKIKNGVLKTTYCLDDSLNSSKRKAHEGKFRLPPSPYRCAVLSTGYVGGSAPNSARSNTTAGKLTSSASLPALVGPRRGCKVMSQLPTMSEDGPTQQDDAVAPAKRSSLPAL